MLQKIKNFFDSESYESQLSHYHRSNILFSVLKFLSFIILSYVSLNLSMDMFKAFGSTPKDVSFFTLLVFGLEMSKTISLVITKSEFITKQWKNMLIGCGFGILYLGLAFVSIYSAYGFVLVATEKTVTTAIAISNTSEIEFYQNNIKILDEKIQSYLPQLQRSDLSLASKTSISRQIDTWEQEKKDTFILIRELQKESAVKQEEIKEAVGMFALMARDMGVDEKRLRFIMMIIMVFVVELCAAMMAPSINIVKPDKKNFVKEEQTKEESSLAVDQTTLNDIEEMKNKIEDKVEEVHTTIEEERSKIEYENTKEIQKEVTLVEEVKPEIKPETKPEVEHKEEQVVEITNKEEIMVEPESTKDYPTRETKFEEFVKGLFNNGTNTYLRDKYDVALEIGMNKQIASNFFNVLMKTKSKNGYSLVEFRPTTKKWHPNFTEQVILNLYKEGKLKVEE